MTTKKKTLKYPGLFITFEGGEGSGKTTQIDLLARWIEDQDLSTLVTRQPGGTAIGRGVRELLLNPRFTRVSPRAELLLYEADRAQHVEEALLPALEAGRVVLSDRFTDSSTVYQGICRNLGADWVLKLNDFATGGLSPDLTLLLDIPEAISWERVHRRGTLDRMERESALFHKKVRQGFLSLAKKFRNRFVVVDASHSIETTAEKIRAIAADRLSKKKLLGKS